MKRFSTTITAKTAAVVLFVLLLAASALCGLGTLYLADVDAYDKTTDFADTPLCVGSVYSYLDEAHQRLINVFDGGIAGDLRQSARERLDALFDPAETNVRLRVLDTETGELLYGVQDVESLTLVAQRYIGWQISSAAPQTVTPTSGATPSVTTPDPTTDNAAEGGAAADNGSTRDDGWETQLLLLGYIDPALPVHDVLASFSALYDRLLAKRYLLPSLCLLFLLLAVLLYVYLLCAAGRRPDDTEGAAQTRVRRIPTDVMYLIWGAAAGALLLLFFNIGNGYFYRFFDYITVSGMVPFVLLLMAGGVSAPVCDHHGAGRAAVRRRVDEYGRALQNTYLAFIHADLAGAVLGMPRRARRVSEHFGCVPQYPVALEGAAHRHGLRPVFAATGGHLPKLSEFWLFPSALDCGDGCAAVVALPRGARIPAAAPRRAGAG